jgi:hypothetical protein
MFASRSNRFNPYALRTNLQDGGTATIIEGTPIGVPSTALLRRDLGIAARIAPSEPDFQPVESYMRTNLGVGANTTIINGNITFNGAIFANIPIANPSFEFPNISNNSFQYLPNPTFLNNWDFTGEPGATAVLNGTNAFGAPNPYPNGNQGLVFQLARSWTSTAVHATQNLSIPAGCKAVRVSCHAGLRFSGQGTSYIRFFLDEIRIAELAVTPAVGTNWRQLIGPWIIIPALTTASFKFGTYTTASATEVIETFIDNIVLEGQFLPP